VNSVLLCAVYGRGVKIPWKHKDPQVCHNVHIKTAWHKRRHDRICPIWHTMRFFSLKSFWWQSNLTDFVRAGFCYHQLCLQKLKFDCLADDNMLVVVVFAHCRQEFGRLHAYEDSSECRRPVHSGTVQPAIPQCRSDGALLHGEQAAYQRCRPHIAHQSRASRSLMQLVPRVVTTDCNRTIPDSEIPAGRGWIRGILGTTRLTAEGRVRTVWDGIGSSCMPTPKDHGNIFSPPPKSQAAA